MKVLVKIGGTLLDDEVSRHRLAGELAGVSRSGHKLVVVHGGGKQMTRFLAERGVESHFVNGLRVTTPEVLDAVLKVVAGSVNQELVAALVAAGVPAVGLTGVDANLTEAEQLDPALGAVGKPVRSNAMLLDLLAANGYLPVVACVAGDRQGRVFNVNADQMAVACAIGFRAERLIFLTDVEGVFDADGGLKPVLTLAESQSLMDRGIATGGMHAKLNSANHALREGIGPVVIAAGSHPGVVAELLAGARAGTRLTREAESQ